MGKECIKLMTRREFLKRGATLATMTATVPSFLGKTALAIGQPLSGELASMPGVPEENVLVVVQLSGGNDGLNTLIPFRNDIYHKLRPALAISPDKVLPLNDELGLHPAMTGLKDLYDDGQLAIVQGVGYPNPDRSHFRSMEIWQTGVAEEIETSGWVGRLFDHACSNAHLGDCSPTLGITVGNALNPALRGGEGIGVAVEDPQRLYRMTALYSASNSVSKPVDEAKPSASPLDFLRRTAMNAELSADKILTSVNRVRSLVDYPANPFAQGLKLIAAMIAGGLDSRVYYISLTGFDTHANQAGVHERLVKMYSDGVAAFQEDLQKLGQDQRVLGMAFSEFGRRVAENGSRGTDHGKAAPMFIFGQPVQPGVIGNHPDLAALVNGDLQFHTDFRSVYSTVLDDWLGVDPEVVLSKSFPKVDLVRV